MAESDARVAPSVWRQNRQQRRASGPISTVAFISRLCRDGCVEGQTPWWKERERDVAIVSHSNKRAATMCSVADASASGGDQARPILATTCSGHDLLWPRPVLATVSPTLATVNCGHF